MNGWFSSLILLGFLGVIARLLLPDGEKSKLYPPLRFLISLLTLLAIFSPLITKKDGAWDLSFFEVVETTPDEMERLLLERSTETMYKAAKEVFPESEFTLYVYTKEGSIPTELAVSCEGDEEDALVDFFRERYPLKVTKYKKGGDNNESIASE